MKRHELKILPIYYNEVFIGNKRFEIRKNDRGFKENDLVKLREFSNGEYTGRYIKVKIGYVFQGGSYGLEEGYCVFSIIVNSFGMEEE